MKYAGERRRSRSPAKGISAINNQCPAAEIGFHIAAKISKETVLFGTIAAERGEGADKDGEGGCGTRAGETLPPLQALSKIPSSARVVPGQA